MFSLLLSLHFETEHTMVYVCLHSGQSLMFLHISEIYRGHTQTHTHYTHTHTYIESHCDTFTSRCGHCKRTMFTTSLCIFCFIFCTSHYKTKVVQLLLIYTHTRTQRKRERTRILSNVDSILFVVFDVCSCLYHF